jgi:uncharacterized membrane protein
VTAYAVFLAVTTAATLAFAAAVGLRAGRRPATLAFLLLVAAWALQNLLAGGLLSGEPASSMETVAFAAFLLAHPLAAAFVVLFLHDRSVRKHGPLLALLFAPVVPILLWRPTAWTVATAYEHVLLNSYLGVALAAALAEAIASWQRSPLQRADAFLLAAGAVVFVVTGPIYQFELRLLAFDEAMGTNPGMFVIALLFGLALLRTRPAPLAMAPLPSRRGPPVGSLAGGEGYVFEERRPTYAARTVRQWAGAGMPVLLIARDEPDRLRASLRLPGANVLCLRRQRHPFARTLQTAAAFVRRGGTGLIWVRDLSWFFANGDPDLVREWLAALVRTVRRSQVVLLLSSNHLLPGELEDLGRLPVRWLALPPVADGLRVRLRHHLGDAGDRLLDRFCAARRRRPADLTLDDVPSLVDYLQRALGRLGVAPKDGTIRANWRATFRALVDDIERFRAAPLEEVVRRDQPPAERETFTDFLVRATDVLPPAGVEASPAPPDMGSEVRDLFREALGSLGEEMLARELARRGKALESLTPEDVAGLAEAATAAVEGLTAVIDVEAARRDMRERVEKLRTRLLQATRGAP